MLPIRQFVEDWKLRWYELFVMDGNSEQPTCNEICEAKTNAYRITWGLRVFKERFQRRYPVNTDAIQLIGEVEQALRDDHGGRLPCDVLSFWWWQRLRCISDRRTFATPEEKNAMVAIYERWKDEAWIKEQFWAIKNAACLDSSGFPDSRLKRLSDEDCVPVLQSLRDWLAKRKNGQVY
ncbi:conserved hypothetical protein [Histoplasma capsulatum var. duboisii H88]|uniref:No significant blast hit, conidia-enriched transcript n=1 Tax=Ajellomyces capsulatus (strain H88) TaxID=544711 RepID=F0USG8_AJEC8|nr:conserved hypothetical protein [Histoplasma capsulatum var. duboisii H88]QSS54442.1 no significant blast hit, conidia-enriched transcript [Histoplasma capsulatum var. duboisii H88]